MTRHGIRRPLAAGIALLALTAVSACTTTVHTSADTRVATPKPASSPADDLTYQQMAQPICSVSTEVPTTWPENARADTEVRYAASDDPRRTLDVGCMDGGQTPEDYLRTFKGRIMGTLPQYHEIALTGLEHDTHGDYAEWEYTFTDDSGPRHSVYRVYGTTFAGDPRVVAWASLQLTAPDSAFASVRPVLDHAVDHITWDS